MATIIQQLNEEEAKSLMEASLVKNRLPTTLWKKLEKDGWVMDDYAIEKKHKGYFIAIEFCFGDFCVGIYSKKGKWILEKKKSVETFIQALAEAFFYMSRVDCGEHWAGENN